MKYRIKTWQQMIAMEDTFKNSYGSIQCDGQSFTKNMICIVGKEVDGAGMCGPYCITKWMLEEIAEEPDVYETHKENLFTHGVKLPAMMEVQSGTVWIKNVVYFISPVGLAVCSDRGYCGYRPIQIQNVEELKQSAYLGL